MLDKSKLCQIEITEGSLKNNYFRVSAIREFFPSDVFGGKNKTSEGKQFSVLTDIGQRFKTDISAKESFRNRGEDGVLGFLRGRFQSGDKAYIYRISNYEYFLSKTIEAIEVKYGDNS